MTEKVFLAFKDDESGRFYYYNQETGETFWEYPIDGVVLNPDTNEIFYNPDLQDQSYNGNEEDVQVNTEQNETLEYPNTEEVVDTEISQENPAVNDSQYQNYDYNDGYGDGEVVSQEVNQEDMNDVQNVEEDVQESNEGNEQNAEFLVAGNESLYENKEEEFSDSENGMSLDRKEQFYDDQDMKEEILDENEENAEVSDDEEDQEVYQDYNQEQNYQTENQEQVYEAENQDVYNADAQEQDYEAENQFQNYEGYNQAQNYEADNQQQNFEGYAAENQEGAQEEENQFQNYEGYNQEEYNAENQEQNYKQENQEQNYEQENQEQNYEQENQEQNYKPEIQEQDYEPEIQEQNYEPEKQEEEAHETYNQEEECVAEKQEEAPQEAAEPESTKIKFLMPMMESDKIYLPINAYNCSRQYSILSYATDNFCRYTRGLFRPEEVPLEELTTFSSKANFIPLLQGFNKDDSKLAVTIFKLILEYTGVGRSSYNDNAACQIVNIVSAHPNLADEVYFQIIKQCSMCPFNEELVRGWYLFLIMSTIFPSSPQVEVYIKTHIARYMTCENKAVKKLAKFCCIRYDGRCSARAPLEKFDNNFILSIPKHSSKSKAIFGVSIFEIMWGQRKERPNFPIPYFLVQMVEELKKKGACTREGIFRIPGNMKKVNALAEAANAGQDVLSGTSLDDIASLMKKWFRDLQDMIVPAKLSDFLYVAVRDGLCIEFAQALPPVNGMMLAYLVGFLQELLEHKAETKMGLSNLAMVFSPNIAQPNFGCENAPPAGTGQSFLEFLIENWDVSAMYPLKI